MNYTYYRRYRSPRRRASSFQSFCAFVAVGVFFLLLVYAGLRLMDYLWEERRDEAVLTMLRGAATVEEWGESEARLASDAEVVLIGDKVHTDFEGWAVLRFLDGSELRMDSDTTVVLHEVTTADPQLTQIVVSVEQGRVWAHQPLNRDPAFQFVIQTSILELESQFTEALLKVNPEQQMLQVFEESAKVLYVDRARDNRTVDTTVLQAGQQTLLTAEMQRALLARENIDLLQDFDLASSEDPFILWNRDGSLQTRTALQDEVAPQTEEEENSSADEPVTEDSDTQELDTQESVGLESENALQIALSGMGSNLKIQKDAIALEGAIVSGEAARVEVTWDGGGAPYLLSGYEPGSDSFRYVADVDYGNLRLGLNRYTIKAYDSAGNVSNVLTVTVEATY